MSGGLVQLRPMPHEPHPYGPFRVVGEGKVVKFPTAGLRVIRWIEKHCVFTKDRWLGTPFRLLPWQKQLLLDMFEQVWDEELGRMRRRYRTAYIGVPKKNGKTELVAALAVYFLLGAGEPDPKIAAVAAADEQADLVFGAAYTMVTESRTLKNVVQAFNASGVIMVKGRPTSWIRRIPANGGKFDGQNLMIGIGDELHEWVTPNQRKMHGMISGALATREEPMHLMITTAGEDEGEAVDDDEVAIWQRLYRYGRRVETGEQDDDSFFFRWWMDPNEESDYRDLDSYMDPLLNPSSNVTVRKIFYQSELGKRIESEMRRYYRNQLVPALNPWLEQGELEACRVPTFELDPAAETYIGWDASTRRDSTAVMVIQRRRDEAGRRRVYAKTRAWERPIGPDGKPVDGWKIPRREVVDYVLELFDTLRDVRGCGYDPFFIAWLVDEMEDRGLPMIEVPQSDSRMIPGTQALYDLILAAQSEDPEAEALAYEEGDVLLERHVRAAKAKTIPRRGTRLVKGEKGLVYDAALALILAVYVAGTDTSGPSVYEERGLLSL